MYVLYNLILVLLTIALLPVILFKLATVPKYRGGLSQKLGRVRKKVLRVLNNTRPIWVHAVSVGEVMAAHPLVRELRKRYPDRKLILSTVTVTGNYTAKQRVPEADAVFYFPFDYPWIVRRVIRRINPAIVLVAETELWPNFFRELNRQGIRRHLSGRDETGKDFVVGVYPMLQEETCFFLAVDFDKKSWSEDAGAYLETCRQLGLTACVERSRSGRGGHIWLFFQEPIPAALARKLGSHILTEIMERRPDIGLDSYDRLFPNQDTLPTGGFGNLIALPMQKQARERGNTLFLDDQCVPYPAQWAFLSTIQKIGRQELETIVQKAEGRGRVVGVRLVPRDEEATTEAPKRQAPAPLSRGRGASASAERDRFDANSNDHRRAAALNYASVAPDALHAELVAIGATAPAARIEPLVRNADPFCSRPEDQF